MDKSAQMLDIALEFALFNGIMTANSSYNLGILGKEGYMERLKVINDSLIIHTDHLISLLREREEDNDTNKG